MIQMHQNNTSDKASKLLEIEAEIELDDLKLRYETAKGLVASDRELELDK